MLAGPNGVCYRRGSTVTHIVGVMISLASDIADRCGQFKYSTVRNISNFFINIKKSFCIIIINTKINVSH